MTIHEKTRGGAARAMSVLIATLGVLGVLATLLWILLILMGVSVQASDGGGAKSLVYAGFALCAVVGLVCFAAAAANSSDQANEERRALGRRVGRSVPTVPTELTTRSGL